MLFTSESVGEGHPDKLCDKIADAILDAYIARDELARVACECIAKSGMVFLFGEITSIVHIDHVKIAYSVLEDLGYDNMTVISCIEEQNPDIGNASMVGAGDQGMMFGYATNETESMMPLTCVLSHAIVKKIAELRRLGEIPWAGSDTKSQVTIEYLTAPSGLTPKRVHTVVVSQHHTPDVEVDYVRQFLRKVVFEVIPSWLIDDHTIFHFQPAGKFTVGGPWADSGLTGRKLMVDTYGGWGSHGGGSFSGKDPTKVDRSGAYAARWVAKSLVAANLCSRVLVQVSYAIGIEEPLSIHVNTYGSGNDSELVDIVKRNFDLTPSGVIKDLNLRNPIYEVTSTFGHFGRRWFPWEQVKKLEV